MTLDLLARTSAILIAASLIAALLRRAAPATRHLVWHFSIVTVLLAPMLIGLAPTVMVPVVPGVPEVPKAWFQTVPRAATAPTVAPTVERGTAGTIWYPTIGTIGTAG